MARCAVARYAWTCYIIGMTAAQTQILDLFRALTPSEREALLPSLVDSLDADDIFDGLTPEQVAALEEGLAQAERGERRSGF